MMGTADVIITADWAGDCLYEFDGEEETDEDGIVKIGGRRFKLKEDKDLEGIWEEKDWGMWD